MGKTEEWDELCPLCGGDCDYGGEPIANELEIWHCANPKCEATIDVPITIIRHAGVTAVTSKAKKRRS